MGETEAWVAFCMKEWKLKLGERFGDAFIYSEWWRKEWDSRWRRTRGVVPGKPGVPVM